MSRLHISRRAHSGFLLLEVLVGIGVFALFVSAVGLVLLYGQENTIMAGDRTRATYFSQQAIDAVRSLRDESFSSLTPGQHGLWIDPNTGTWAFSGSHVVNEGGYITHVYITDLGSSTVRVGARTRWKHGYSRSGSVLITTDLTDLRASTPVGNWSSVTLEGSWTDAGIPVFTNVALYDNYLFAVSGTSGGGRGLYVFDISSTSSPSRIATSFDLGYTGYDILVKGARLYVLTSDNSAELKVYNISSPTSFSASNLVTTYNLPGNSRGRALGLHGTTLLIGATESVTAGQDELYAFDISNSGSVVFRDSIDTAASIYAIAVSGTSALLATSDNAAELRFAKVNVPSDITFPANHAYNATDTQDGIAVAAVNTSAVLGRSNGTAIDELVMVDIEGGGGYPPPPPGPWFHEVGGSVNDIAVDPTGCYAFLATDFSSKDFKIVQIGNTSLPETASYNYASGFGRGIHYDISRDRVFLMTDNALLIFRPAVGSSACS